MPRIPAPFVGKTVLSPLNGLRIIVQNHLTKYGRVYFWANCSVPLVCMSAVMPVPHCFDFYSFVVGFEVTKCEISNLVLFKNCLTVILPLHQLR